MWAYSFYIYILIKRIFRTQLFLFVPINSMFFNETNILFTKDSFKRRCKKSKMHLIFHTNKKILIVSNKKCTIIMYYIIHGQPNKM